MQNLKIFTESADEETLNMIYSIASNSHFKDSKIRIMPDTHVGTGIVVGFTCPFNTYVNPEHIGVDIGCGVDIALYDQVLSKDQYPLFEQRIRNTIGMGKELMQNREFNLKDFYKFVRKELSKAMQCSNGLINDVSFNNEHDISNWCKSINLEEKIFYKSINTLGGGNHFIELDYNEDKNLMGVSVHTGSRNVGQKVCKKWTKKAIPTGGYLSGDMLSGYLSDMVIAQAYAKYNRMIILEKISAIYKKMCKGKVIEIISSIHNYLDFSDMIMRKGAIRSYEGEKMIIPFNMRDGIAICEGKSNEDWNYSAPHGSGRIMSRNKAKENISLEEFQQSMLGIYSNSVCVNTIDESPMAYKDTNEIIKNIKPTCKILYFMKPVINIKSDK